MISLTYILSLTHPNIEKQIEKQLMQRFLVLLIFLAITNPMQAQSSFSFNCLKDTTISCNTPCITLHTTIPDIFSSTTSYTVNQTCFRPYISPAAPGPSANLTIDDRYSPLIDITFPFSFYGNTYTKLAASTNGFLTFDNSKASTFSHYGILANGSMLSSTTGTPQDLPSSLYDGAIIMGPYHDLDPNNATSTLQMKYDVVGTAPYRKWILSYYNVPLYTTACLNLATNTHQIVLYETLGIVDVCIYNKEICLNWNYGRSMIGMQDMNKTSAIMAPSRQATSVPWGSQTMNESWRFVPTSGSSLFKRVELYTLSGSFIGIGITSNAGNNLLDVNFNNVCPSGAGDSYLVKSFYKNPDGSAVEIVATDTINVSRGENISASIVSAKCNAASTGYITITSPVGPAYEYSIDGNNWQSSNAFLNLPVGTYTIYVRKINASCISSKKISIDNTPFDASIITTPASCGSTPSGTITILPVNGTAPYLYSLNGGAFQSLNLFTNLGFGNYNIVVKDAFGCSFSTTAFISTAGPAFSGIVKNAKCGGTVGGSITLSASSGIAPYTYSIEGSAFQNSNVFNNLNGGVYSITIKDATGCSSILSFTVGTNVSIIDSVDIKMPTCFGNNNGSITVKAFGAKPFQYALNGNAYQTTNVFNNISAGIYLLHVKDSLGCIKDDSVIVLEPNIFKISTITTSASTCITPDGRITIKANGGTTPYYYSIDNGNSFTLNNFFNVKSGRYNILVKDKNGCTTTGSATVIAINDVMKLDLGPDKDLCYGDSVSLIPTTTPPADYFRWSLPAGLSDTTSGSPKASPSDTTKYYLTARTGYCERIDSITINVLHKPIANAGADTLICNNTYAILHGSATNLSGGVKYLWTPSADVASPNSATTIVRPKNSRPNPYILQVTDMYGCNFKVFDEVIVIMNAPVIAFAGNDTVASIGVPHQLFGSGGTKYLWSPSNVLNNPLLQNPLATLQNDTRFNLLVKDTLGCIGTSSVLIKTYKGTKYYVPNAFTPNGDGVNDVFRGVAPGIQATFYFKIFNRWGLLVYESKDVQKGWDGTYMGMLQPTAVYVWIIKGLDVNSKPVELRGTVTLIR